MKMILKKLQKELKDVCFNTRKTIIIGIEGKIVRGTYCLNGRDLDNYSITEKHFILNSKDNITKICLHNVKVRINKGTYILKNKENGMKMTVDFVEHTNE